MGSTKEKSEIAVLITNNFKSLKFPAAKVSKLVKAICGRFNISRATISILITDDSGIHVINRRFLKRSAATDCISFNLSDSQKTGSTALFDIVVNGEMAVRQAKLRSHSAEAELALYITHGLLHNLGFDDLKPGPAEKMHKAEDAILRQFGYGNVYNKRATVKK